MKTKWSYWKSLLYAAGFLCLGVTTTHVFADGTETLGPPSIPIATGSGIQAAGVGLAAAQPGNINIDVPAGTTVQQVLLYWSGVSTVEANLDDTINIGGNPVTGTALSAAPTFFQVGGADRFLQAYRADITALGLVSAGANSLDVSGLDFQFRNDGAGILVIYDDGSSGSGIAVRDGNDFAFFNLPSPLDTTVPQTINFPATSVERIAKLKMFFADVAGTGSGNGFRPSVIDVTVGGVTTSYPNLLNSNDGEEWDTMMLDVAVPAGVTSMTVQALSKDVGASPCAVAGDCGQPASFIWLAAAVSIIRDPQVCVGSIGDFVWNDLNQNGIQDAGEPGIPGVTRVLKDGQGKVIDTATTDKDGFYEFTGLSCPATYTVEVDPGTIPPDLGPTLPNQGNDPAVDSDVSPIDVILTEANPDDPTIDCGFAKCMECDGKVTELALRYQGAKEAFVTVEQKKDDVVVFEGMVQPGEVFSFVGEDKNGTLGTEIRVFVDGAINTKIHTSCSQPIGPGLVFGDFKVESGKSLKGGLMCPFPPQPPSGCSECEGKVTKMTLQYNGAAGAAVEVVQKKDGDTVFSGSVVPGGQFTFSGTDKKGTLGTEIIILVDGAEQTRIHTSCSQPIGPGLVSGDFEVIEAYSLKGGLICPIDPPPMTAGKCEGKVTNLTMQYNGIVTAGVTVVQKKDKVEVFNQDVPAGGQFSFSGEDKKGTLGTEIILLIDGTENTRIHTSCSQPIGPGLVSGAFEVISGSSRKGGALPPL